MFHLGLVLAQLMLAPEPRLPVAAVTASSAKAGAVAAMAIDGKLDTSWQPDADGAFGIGQWIRLDLGRVIDVTAIEIQNGVQRVESGVDQFCQYGRASTLRVYGDTAHVNIWSDDAYHRVLTAKVGSPGFQKPLRTRYLTIVVDAMATGYREAGTLAMAEISVQGTSAPDHPSETGPVTCGSVRAAHLRDAILDHCANQFRSARPTAECTLMRNQFDFCAAQPPKFLPIAAKDFDTGAFALSVKSRNPPFPQLGLTANRGVDGRWVVATLTCQRGSKPCGLPQSLASDGDRTDLEVSTPKICQSLDGTLVRAP